MDKILLNQIESSYQDAMDKDFGACLSCNKIIEGIAQDTQKAECPHCHKDMVFGCEAIVQRFA